MSSSNPYPDTQAFFGDLKSAIAFLTRIPAEWLAVDGSLLPDFTRASALFPLVGMLIGIAGGIVLAVASALAMPPLVAAALAVATTMGLTGALHEDGLADVADGLGGASPAGRLEIMHDSRIGTFGAAALVLSLIIRVACLAAILAHGAMTAALALILAEGISRAGLVRMWQAMPPAQDRGLARDTGPPDQTAMAIALAIGGGLALIAIPVLGLRPAVLAALLAAISIYAFMKMTERMIGGRTGDTLGACQQLALVAWLIGAATL